MPNSMTGKLSKQHAQYQLGFPIHGLESSKSRLQGISNYIEEQGFSEEFLNSGQVNTRLEEKVAKLFGKQAALWFSTGTMAQGVAAQIYASRHKRRDILLHPTSHLLLHESEGYRYAHNLSAQEIGDFSSVLSPDDFNQKAACAFIELSQRHTGGMVPSWDELSQIKHRAHELEMPLHVDGARIWSCRPIYENRSYAQIVDGFSSVYVSLYKDIGAMGGALLIGDKDFIDEAKIWRERLGGLMVQPWVLVVDALRLMDERIERMEACVIRAREIASFISSESTLSVLPEVPHTNLFHVHLPCNIEKAEQIQNIIVESLDLKLSGRFWEIHHNPNACAIEMHIGEVAIATPDDLIKSAINILSSELA